MGTPDFAEHTLRAIYEAGHEIAAVYCQPDKPVGRKQVLTAPPVKEYALSKGLTVYQPQSLRTEEAYNQLKELNPELIVVVAYGKLLPENILKLPKYGCINGHASLLPKYRGASPIQWAIVCGETVTGMSTMYMDVGMDTGDILETKETVIGENETAEQLFDRLAVMGASLMLSTIDKAEKGQLCPKKQDESKATYAPIIKKEMGLIDFSKTAQEIHNLVRGFNSWPIAYCMYGGKRMKVYTTAIRENTNKEPGTVIKADDSLVVACKNGTSIELLLVQLEGGKPMQAKDMLKGHKIEVNQKLV